MQNRHNYRNMRIHNQTFEVFVSKRKPGETMDDTLRRLMDLPKLPARPKHSPFKHPIRDMRPGDQHVMKVKVYDRSNKEHVDHEVLKHKRYVFRVTKGTGRKFHMVFVSDPEVFGVVVTRVI